MNCVLYISLLQVDPYPISPFVTWCACTTSAALRSQHGGVWQVPLCVWRSSWQHFTLRSIQVWGHQRPILSSSPPDISFGFEQFILFFTRSIKTQFVTPAFLHLRTFLFVSITIPAYQFFPPKTNKNKITLYGSLGLKHLHGLVLSLHKEGNFPPPEYL